MPVSKPSKKAQVLSVREVRRASGRVKSSRTAGAAPAAEGDAGVFPGAVEESDDAGEPSSEDEDDEENQAYVAEDDEDDDDEVGGEDDDDDGGDEEPDEDDEEVVTPKKRGAKSAPSSAGSKKAKKETTAAAEGKVLIGAETLPFLRDLADHSNDRDWFHANGSRWQEVRSDFEIFVDYLKDRVRALDPGLPNEDARNCVFRINRDVRFYPGPLYKTSMACSFPKRVFPPTHPACFYLKIEPGKSWIGGGMYDIPSGKLAAIRSAIDADKGAGMKAVLEKESFKKVFGKDPWQWNESLKTAPKGYKKDHEAIKLLRLKSYGIRRNVDDDVVTSEGFMDVVMVTWTELLPWIQLLNSYAS
ncbi:hypothetical protein HK101_003603 [Irineochytrium annulatum]|nr:hypothetical protein HK101_003603 [Irineochytrium annulatum]